MRTTIALLILTTAGCSAPGSTTASDASVAPNDARVVGGDAWTGVDAATGPQRDALPSCRGSLFVDTIASDAWLDIDVVATEGTRGIRDAVNEARDHHADVPVRIRLAPGFYADTLGAEIWIQHVLRTEQTPIWIVATDPTPNATRLGHGINMLGVAYVAIEGITIGPEAVGPWNGTRHEAPLPLQAQAGIHIAGAALHGERDGAPGGALDPATYGHFEPAHHIVIRRVTIQNLFEDDAFDAETSEGQSMDGIKLNQAEDVWILDSRISSVTRHGIDNVGVHREAVCRTVIERTGGGLGSEAKGGSVDVLFEGNVYYRVRRVELGGEATDATYYFSADGRYDYEGLRIVLRNNLIIDAREAALEFSGCLHCAAIANTILQTASYVVPNDGGEVRGGDGVRIHDSVLLGTSDGAGSDCVSWNPATNDYDFFDTCWRVGSAAPAPVGRVLPSDDVVVVDNAFGSAHGAWGDALGGSTAPCPLNTIDAPASVTFDANYWWNGPRRLPTAADGCTEIPEGSHGTMRTDAPTPSPLWTATDVDGSSLTSVAASARTALTPAASSPLVGHAVAYTYAVPWDQALQARPTPATIGALEP